MTLIVLDRSGKEPRLSLVKGGKNGMQTVKLSPGVRATDIGGDAIRPSRIRVIHPFLSQPRVVAQGAFDDAPFILGSNAERVVLGAGDDAFATGGKAGVTHWNVLRPGKALKDPETGDVLGYEVEYLGDARTAGRRRTAENPHHPVGAGNPAQGQAGGSRRQHRLRIHSARPGRPDQRPHHFGLRRAVGQRPLSDRGDQPRQPRRPRTRPRAGSVPRRPGSDAHSRRKRPHDLGQ